MKPAATSDPTRETTAMIIETTSIMAAEYFDICCRMKDQAYGFAGLKFPPSGSSGCCGPKESPLGTMGVVAF